MILGRFTWRGMTVEADAIRGSHGEVVWLRRVNATPATGLAVIRDGRLIPTAHAPQDDEAPIQLRSAFDAFRARTSGAST